MLFALVLLQACASGPTVLTDVELRDVPVTVRTPLPNDCFAQHSVSPQVVMPAEGSLSFEEYTTWADALVTIVSRYRTQTTRCSELNVRDPAVPFGEP